MIKNSGIIIASTPPFITVFSPLGAIPHPLGKIGKNKREREDCDYIRERENIKNQKKTVRESREKGIEIR